MTVACQEFLLWQSAWNISDPWAFDSPDKRSKKSRREYDPDLDDHFVSDYLDPVARREKFRGETPKKNRQTGDATEWRNGVAIKVLFHSCRCQRLCPFLPRKDLNSCPPIILFLLSSWLVGARTWSLRLEGVIECQGRRLQYDSVASDTFSLIEKDPWARLWHLQYPVLTKRCRRACRRNGERGSKFYFILFESRSSIVRLKGCQSFWSWLPAFHWPWLWIFLNTIHTESTIRW